MEGDNNGPTVVQAQVVGNSILEAPGQTGMMVFQETSECCRCCCCQPNINWNIHDYVEEWHHGMDLEVKMSIKEEASWFGRCWSFCWPGWRATKYTVHDGKSGPALFTIEKGATCSHCPMFPPFFRDGGTVRCCWCCCLPYLETKDVSGSVLGTTKIVCWFCESPFVPRYIITNKRGEEMYHVRPDTCCAGLCIKCKCGGKGGKCCRVPYPIREPRHPYKPIGDAAITDVWAGLQNECCTQREMYQVKFPQGLAQSPQDEQDMRKVIVGTTLLIDLTMAEQNDNQ
mmetsp:Transcript_33603/g.78546  ORF Transcript_33603/g.78546 Transcript_33603/m.78546 type:complete len:285 (-) Transcript_33603:65-919(-)|eukprot:CAMPEP_0178427832 /NCGR_PEP_ID=MMETSP0689_2-20121128/29951_1 /TAXON_ID=160604 /ORGANISM="Amphidinium massartii, Strain CS-259" /LENGTH=284 /DNA_ID=CAMNT_0020049557 /DNA_START=127 /DNA_END=981 /DNA_ORIENTATION=-